MSDDLCIVCGKLCHGAYTVTTASGREKVITRLPPGPKVHLWCLLDLPKKEVQNESSVDPSPAQQ